LLNEFLCTTFPADEDEDFTIQSALT